MNSPQQYTKKPVTITAIKWDGKNTKDVIAFAPTAWESNSFGKALIIETLEGHLSARIGDYIIKGVAGEFYPCRADIFARTYESENDK